jgi:threonyl-tRNA synthetase
MLALPISENQIVQLISQLDLAALEKVRKAIVKKEAYFKRFQKAPINEVVEDFKNEGYSSHFLANLEEGLKKSRMYQKNSKE